MIDGFVKDGELTWDEVNAQRKKIKLPKGHSIPEPFPPKSDGKPLHSRSITLNGSAPLHFAVNR